MRYRLWHQNNLTLDNGKVYNIKVPEVKAVRLASKRLNRAYVHNGGKKSCNHRKRQAALQKAYERQTNKKTDAANKVVSDILNGHDYIAIQDEMIANWHHGLFGRSVQHSAMGYIKAKLKNSPKTHVVPRSFPSTQKCPVCGKNTKHPISERSYKCAYCGYTHPSRDVKSAIMILDEALLMDITVSAERRTKSPVEVGPPDDSVKLNTVIKVSPTKQEAQAL